ncbi:MAG TPA: hypothetical protein VMF32_13810 [Xanthobacteraceae bacterium]|nr:hypothetical protein [Xanthobacteraceae bacterium]
MDFGLYIGTIGTSVWFSYDLGETWDRPYSESGLYLECRVWSLTTNPKDPARIFAGTDEGIYRWNKVDRKWTHRRSAMDGTPIWALAQSPHDPNLMLAGTQPAALYRSRDGGENWSRVNVELATSCIFVQRPRVTQILFDPVDPNLVWMGVEIDGIYRSTDAGETWTKCSKGLVSEDVHGLAVLTNGTRRLFATTNKGLHFSRDDGSSWQLKPLPSEWQYTRAVMPHPDRSNNIFLTNGNGPPGSAGKLLRSADGGETWSDSKLPGELNSTVWCIAAHRFSPKVLFVCTNFGQLFRSLDGGESWQKMKREFGEVRAAMLHPL